MQTRGLSFWLYWSAVTALIGLIGSGVDADANISPEKASVTANAAAVVPELAALSPAAAGSVAAPLAAPLTETQSGEPDVVQASDEQVGLASWYGNQHQGRLTASGERFDERKLTAAHRTLPLDTKVKVTNLENGKSIEVKVNDRGPYIPGRVLDLSTQAAKALGMEKEGLALVRIEVMPEQVANLAVN
jgi:peptidoglycan lytic transglycosylase